MFSKNETLKAKGIAILLLLFHHLFYDSERIEQSGVQFLIFQQDIVQQIAVAARICVWIFVFLSAYGLTYQYVNRKEDSKIQFLIKRWFLLMKTYWPIYILIFLLYSCIVGNVANRYQHGTANLILDILGISDFFGQPMLLGVWWYMCFAQVLILSIPLVNLICEKLGWSSYLLMFCILQYLPDGIKSSNGGRYSNYFLVVILAVLCARNQVFNQLLSQQEKKKWKLLRGSVCFGLILILLYIKLKLGEIDVWQVNSFISGIVVFLICYFTSAFLTNKIFETPLKYLGKHSGNMFLVHAFFYTYTPPIVYWSKSAVGSFITLLFISLIVSVLIENIKRVLQYEKISQKILEEIICKCTIKEI